MRGTLYLTVSAQDQRNQEPVSSSEHLVRVQKGRNTKQDAEDDSCGHRRWVLVQRVDPAPATVGFHHGENCQRSLAKKCVSQRSSKPLINKKSHTLQDCMYLLCDGDALACILADAAMLRDAERDDTIQHDV